MTSDVVLTSALRNNLLSLQNTQRLIDETQLRLATGLKVNSALDNPQSFFASQSLNNRASDLSRLLDGVNQSIRTIEAANNGITALTDLIAQANSIVSSARDELAASEGSARLVSTLDLSDVTALSDLGDGTVIDGTEVFSFITTDDDGDRIVQQITLDAGGTIYNFAEAITNAFADDEAGEIVASVNDKGNLIIESKDGRSFAIEATDAAGTADLATDLQLLGLDSQFALQDRTIGTADGAFVTNNIQAATIVAGNTVSTISLYEGTGDLAEAGDTIDTGAVGTGGGQYFDANGNVVLDGVSAISISVDIDGTVTTATGATFQALVDSVNTNTAINSDVRAEFDNLTGQLRLTKLTDDVQNVTFTATTLADGTANLGLGNTSGKLDPVANGNVIDRAETESALDIGAGNQDFVINFNSSTAALDSLANDYNSIRQQIDELVTDASYRGINLLNGDDLITFFNEDNTNSLTIDGQIFTSAGLGLNEATFRSSSEIELSAIEVRSASTRVRSFGSSISNDLSIVTTRRDFTQSTINTLQAGADDLTVADQNEEGANLLALQTRQALGTTSLSLASQSQQSVLRLF